MQFHSSEAASGPEYCVNTFRLMKWSKVFLIYTFNELLIHLVLIKVHRFRFTVVKEFICIGDRQKATAMDSFLLLNRHNFYTNRGFGLL